MFPTPRLGRYLIKTGSDIYIYIFFFVCVLFGLNFYWWANIFFIAFKNINNIVKGASVILLKQIAKNNILYIY